MITIHTWMFISSYEKLRKKIINNRTINLNFLKKGSFILKLQHKDVIINRKIIKK